jgi:hypothetical protein
MADNDMTRKAEKTAARGSKRIAAPRRLHLLRLFKWSNLPANDQESG